METLYSRSEEIYTKCMLSGVALDRPVIALSKVMSLVLASDIPVRLRPRVLSRALRILRVIEAENNLLDLGFARYIPHPTCGEYNMLLGEMWELPREHEWLCGECGWPLYDIQTHSDVLTHS